MIFDLKQCALVDSIFKPLIRYKLLFFYLIFHLTNYSDLWPQLEKGQPFEKIIVRQSETLQQA